MPKSWISLITFITTIIHLFGGTSYALRANLATAWPSSTSIAHSKITKKPAIVLINNFFITIFLNNETGYHGKSVVEYTTIFIEIVDPSKNPFGFITWLNPSKCIISTLFIDPPYTFSSSQVLFVRYIKGSGCRWVVFCIYK